MKRIITGLLAILVLSAPLAACGKKGKLEAPPDSTYPRQYPTPQ